MFKHAFGSSLKALLLLTAAGCNVATAPCASPEIVIVTETDLKALRLMDPAGRCGDRRIGLGETLESVSLSPDETKTYVIVKIGSTVQREVVALETASARILWRHPLDDASSQQTVKGEVAAVSHDGTDLYMWRTSSDGTWGIARFNLQTREVVAFSGPWNLVAGGLVPLKPSAAFAQGALAVVGLRGGLGPRGGQARLYFLNPASLAVLDSIQPSTIANEDDVWQFLPAPDGQSAYVAGRTTLVRYDLVQRWMTASKPREANGLLSLMPGGGTLVLSDGGSWPDSPGSGVLRLYDANLVAAGTIDVSAPLGGQANSPTATQVGMAMASKDGRTLYVRAGSEERGPLYPVQPARLLIVDMIDRSVVRSMSLGGYGLGLVLVAAPAQLP